MLLNLVNLLSGTVSVTVESGFPERVLNLCSAHDLPFWDMTWSSPTCFSFKLSRRHYLQLRRLAKRLDCTLTVEKKQGVPFFVRRFRRRYVLLAGLAAAVALLFFGSLFVWDFDIEGNEKVSDERILRALEAEGVRCGTFGLGIHPETLKNHILLEIPELSWLTVNVNGFRATVIVRERIQPPPLREEMTNANVVAKRDGLVTLVQLYGGHAEVMKGSTVTKGQLLISGVADINDRGAYMTRGEGKVYARTWYDLTARQSKTVREKSYTGRKKVRVALIFGKQRIKITPGSSISYTDYDKIIKKQKLRLPGGAALPLALERTVTREYTVTERALSAQEAQARAEQALERRLSDCLAPDGKVRSSNCTLRDTGSVYEVTLHAECEEQIGQTVELDESESTKEKTQHGGTENEHRTDGGGH